MKRNRLFILLCLVLTLSSCGPTHFYAGFTPNDAMDGMMLLGPCSVQYYIDQQNKEAYDDSLSLASEALITSLVEDLALPVTRRAQLSPEQKEEAIAFMSFIKDQNKKTRGDYPIPLMFDELLEAAGQRYGLLIYASGMTRDKKGYAKEVTKNFIIGAAAAILTMGTMSVYGMPANSASFISVAILDSEMDRIAFYELSNEFDSNPFDPKPIRRQLYQIFSEFFE